MAVVGRILLFHSLFLLTWILDQVGSFSEVRGHEIVQNGSSPLLSRLSPSSASKESELDKTKSTASTPSSTTSRPRQIGSFRARNYSAQEHAREFAQYEAGAAKVVIQDLLYSSSINVSRSDRARSTNIPSVISYHDGETIATIFTDPTGNISRCNLFEIKRPEDSDRILAQFAKETQRPVQKISFRTMLTVITACQAIDPVPGSNTVQNHSVLTETGRAPPIDVRAMRTVVSGILPGTKWCGLGDIAQDYEDLGQDKTLDKCCRAHDHCPTKLRSFRSGYGLINWSLYTKSHCDCDSLLYECLKKTGGSTAELLGNFYFNVLQIQCIDEDNPPRQCVIRDRSSNSCRTWASSPTSDKVLFFRDVRRQF